MHDVWTLEGGERHDERAEGVFEVRHRDGRGKFHLHRQTNRHVDHELCVDRYMQI